MLCLSTHTGDAVLRKQPLPGSCRILFRDSSKVPGGQACGHSLHFIQRKPGISAERPSIGTAEQAHGKDGALVGIHAAGDPVHGLLRSQTLCTEHGKGFPGGAVCGLHADPGAACKIAFQRIGAGYKQGKIHILVAAAVVLIHQAGLGGGVHL